MYFMSVNKLRDDADRTQVGAAIGAHVQWSKSLIAAGTLAQAGRWGESGGMAIIKARDLAEAEAIQKADPLIASGLAVFELERLYPDVELG